MTPWTRSWPQRATRPAEAIEPRHRPPSRPLHPRRPGGQPREQGHRVGRPLRRALGRWYIDTSAAAKLLIEEAESAALIEEIRIARAIPQQAGLGDPMTRNKERRPLRTGVCACGRRWTQPEHVEAARTAEFSMGAGETGCGKRGATNGGTRVWGGVEPSETLSNTTHRDRSGRDPNRPRQRRERHFDLQPARHPPGDCVGEDPAVTSSRAICRVSFLTFEQQPRPDEPALVDSHGRRPRGHESPQLHLHVTASPTAPRNPSTSPALRRHSCRRNASPALDRSPSRPGPLTIPPAYLVIAP